MQKEIDNSNTVENEDGITDRTMSENVYENISDNSTDIQASQIDENASSTDNLPAEASDADFEKLIKGPYKDAFAKKVQGIINKRFKEQKNAEGKSAEANQNYDKNNTLAEATANKADDKSNNSAYEALINAGIDPDTAYRVLHLDEIMDSSVRYGAELASKHIADSLRQKAARPAESALSGKGYSAKTSVGSLTPEKRRELAKKALMGEQIGF